MSKGRIYSSVLSVIDVIERIVSPSLIFPTKQVNREELPESVEGLVSLYEADIPAQDVIGTLVADWKPSQYTRTKIINSSLYSIEGKIQAYGFGDDKDPIVDEIEQHPGQRKLDVLVLNEDQSLVSSVDHWSVPSLGKKGKEVRVYREADPTSLGLGEFLYTYHSCIGDKRSRAFSDPRQYEGAITVCRTVYVKGKHSEKFLNVGISFSHPVPIADKSSTPADVMHAKGVWYKIALDEDGNPSQVVRIQYLK